MIKKKADVDAMFVVKTNMKVKINTQMEIFSI